MNSKDMQGLIEALMKQPVSWELISKSKVYSSEPVLTEDDWKDLFRCLETDLPEKRDYSEPLIHGTLEWSKSSWFYKLELLTYIEYLKTLFGTEAPPTVKHFEKNYPSVHQGLCVNFSKIPVLFNDETYEPIVLKWRLQRGL